MGGSLLKVVSESANYYIVECIDMSAPIPSLDFVVNRPWLWGWTTEVTARVLPDGTYVVSKWPNLKHYGDWGTPYLLIGLSGTNRVSKERVVKVENWSEYSPYN